MQCGNIVRNDVDRFEAVDFCHVERSETSLIVSGAHAQPTNPRWLDLSDDWEQEPKCMTEHGGLKK